MKFYQYISLFALSSFLLLSCGNNETDTSSTDENAPKEANKLEFTQEELEANNIQLGRLEQRSFPETIKTTGFVDVPPENRVSINAFIGGYIKKFTLIEGQEVSKGELLLTLENPEYVELQQEYLESVEQLSYLKSDFERQEIMHSENITSKKNFLKAESAYKTTLARANGLRQKLRMLNISAGAVEEGKIISEVPVYAPIAGKISRVNVSRGEYVSPVQSMLEILNPQDLHLELSIFEKDVMRIEEGQKISFSTPEISQDDFEAEVFQVGRAIDNETRTVKLHAHINDSLASRFAVGMFIDAEIHTEELMLPGLPQEAVKSSGDRTFVLALSGRKDNTFIFERVSVRPGKSHKGYVAIEEAQALNGRQVIVSGTF